MNSNNIIAYSITAYIVIGIISFGQGWAGSTEKCETRRDGARQTECFVINGIGAGVFWPLYWSQKAAQIGGDDDSNY